MLARKLTFGAFVSLAALGLGCAGQVDDDDDHEVTEIESTSAELAASPDPAEAAEQGEPGDKDCDDNDGHHKKHHNHRHHKFKVLDRLDGAHDNAITIASLPDGLPDRLIAKLHKIDRDHDGVVTKAEAKAWIHHRKKHGAKGR